MNILHIISGLENGGTESVLYNLLKATSSFQHTVVSLGNSGKYGRLLEEQGVRVICLEMPRGKVTIKGLLKLIRILFTEKSVIVQTWMYHADFLGGLFAFILGRGKIFWGVHNSYFEKSTTPFSTYLVLRFSAILSNIVPTNIICCSKHALHEHLKRGYESIKLVSVSNGFNLDVFSPNLVSRKSKRLELNCGDDTIILGMVARWNPAKDHSCLISALSIFDSQNSSDWKCILIGTNIDESNKQLNELIQSYKLEKKIVLLGPQSDVAGWMNSLDIHILSSHGESFGNVTAEAMACGTPAIMTDVGDAREIIGDLGWVVPIHDPQTLAGSIADAIFEKSLESKWNLRKKLARKRIVEKYSIEAMALGYERLWRSQI